jgi:hypothetical protein
MGERATLLQQRTERKRETGAQVVEKTHEWRGRERGRGRYEFLNISQATVIIWDNCIFDHRGVIILENL